MNTNPFLINPLLNNKLIILTLTDNGCLCSGIIDSTLADWLKLPRFPILPRKLETAEKSSTNKLVVDLITHVSLDLDGLVTGKLWLYIVPHSTHEMILG